MRGENKSLFIFLMGLAWKFRYSMPLLLSSTVAMLGRAWMLQIRVQTIQGMEEQELPYDYDEDRTHEDDTMTWETESSNSWETMSEEEAYG